MITIQAKFSVGDFVRFVPECAIGDYADLQAVVEISRVMDPKELDLNDFEPMYEVIVGPGMVLHAFEHELSKGEHYVQ